MSRHFNINVILVLKLNFFNMSASQFFYKEFINSLYNKHMSELDREYPNIVICALERIWKNISPICTPTLRGICTRSRLHILLCALHLAEHLGFRKL